MKLKKLISFLDGELKTDKFTDKSLNGLQVEGTDDVKKICLAVDASEHTINLAKKKNADILIVHHGLFWGHEQPVTGLLGKRVKALIKNDISLYASHLPLDCHPTFGNNAVMGKLLGIKKLTPFGQYSDALWGFRGTINVISIDKFLEKVESVLRAKVKILPFGKKEIKNVGIVSGAGSFAIEEAEKLGLDVLLTGETSHQAYSVARDLQLNVIFAGHYQTEVFGLLGLEKLLEKKYGIDCEFIPAPSGL